VAYRADIEIGVKGTRQLEQLRSLITQTTQAYESLNRIASKQGKLVQNVSNYTDQLNRASRALENVTLGSQAESKAIREYVTAMGQANAARARQNFLIEQEISSRRKIQATANAGFGQYGPALPPRVTGKAGGMGKNIRGAVSNAAVGGAFPMLFGQSGAASAGGAIGGVLGSAIPGFNAIGGFGGSLIGTVIGDKIGKSSQIKELASDIGFSTTQTKLLTDAFKQAGQEFDKFALSVQNIRGLSLSIEDQADAINLVSTLTEKYGGQIDKVTNAFTSALESGKVTQATLNQLTSQGIPIQQALADKYKVSRDAILAMAKDGKISTQDLTDTLVDMGNKGVAAVNKPVSGFDQFNKGVKSLMSAIGELASAIIQLLTPAFNWLAKQLAVIINAAAQGIRTVATLLSGGNAQTVVANARARKRLAAEGGPSTGTRYLTPDQQARLNVLQQEEQKKQIKSTKIGAIEAPGQAPPSGGKTGSRASDKAANDAAREAERVANIVRDQAAITEQKKLQAQYSQGLFVAEVAKDEVLKIQLQREQELGDISLQYSKQINDEKAKGNSAAVKEAFTRTALVNVQLVELKTAQQLKKLELDRKENFNNLLGDLDQELKLRSATTEEARTQLRIAYEMEKLDKTKMYTSDQLAVIESRKQQLAAPKTPFETIRGAAGAASDDLLKLIDVGNQVVTAADAIGTSFATAFKGVISGTVSAQQALATFFQSVADSFLDMAAQIIAKWITMTILNSVLKLFPGGGTTSNLDAPANINNPLGNLGNIGAPYAEGGFVTGPTNAIIGEGGQPEYVIPASKMQSAMARYSRGARGEAVIPTSGGGEGDMGSAPTGGPMAIDVRYSVERINNVEYVTSAQFQAGIQQAAMQGATQGEQRTLRRLQMSASTRRRVGMA